MPSFQITLKYTRDELERVMREKHGVANITIRTEPDATGVITFLLAAVGAGNLHVNGKYDAEIDGDEVLVRVENGDYTEGWHERVQHTLKRLDDHIRK